MQCADFERRLNLVLDQRRPADEDALLQLHAADCPECQQLLVGQARLFEMLHVDILELPKEFSNLAARTVSVPVRLAKSPLRKPQVIAAILATAATLFIIAAPIAQRFSGPKVALPQRGNRPQRTTPTTIATWQAGAVAVNKDNKKEKDREDNKDEIDKKGEASSTEPDELRRMIQEIWQKIPEVPQSQLEPIDRLAGGFKPLAATIGAALDAIRRSLPVGRDQEIVEPQAHYLGWKQDLRLS